MEIHIRNKMIRSTFFSDSETAWRIEDAPLVLEYLQSKNKLVLGGDILTDALEYTYDNWYYNVDSMQNLEHNVEYSVRRACEYISNYAKANGTEFHVVFVIE